MLTRAQKEQQVADLKERFGRASSVYVADYRGLDVESVTSLRRKLRQEGEGSYEYRVTKNTLLRLAAEGSDVAQIVEHFRGPTCVAISYGDPVGLAKILVDFAKQHEIFEIRGGLVDGRAVDAREVATLATLPSLEALRAQMVGLIQAPATKMVRLLAAPAGQLARVVEARRRQMEESGGAS